MIVVNCIYDEKTGCYDSGKTRQEILDLFNETDDMMFFKISDKVMYRNEWYLNQYVNGYLEIQRCYIDGSTNNIMMDLKNRIYVHGNLHIFSPDGFLPESKVSFYFDADE